MKLFADIFYRGVLHPALVIARRSWQTLQLDHSARHNLELSHQMSSQLNLCRSPGKSQENKPKMAEHRKKLHIYQYLERHFT
jgi:hypothetical protein